MRNTVPRVVCLGASLAAAVTETISSTPSALEYQFPTLQTESTPIPSVASANMDASGKKRRRLDDTEARQVKAQKLLE
jgi:hypothetical protein